MEQDQSQYDTHKKVDETSLIILSLAPSEDKRKKGQMVLFIQFEKEDNQKEDHDGEKN